jgi:hypothetical protein
MIRSVTFEKTTYAGLPNKFEAGTPAIASQIGLGAAIDYLNGIGREAAVAYEAELCVMRRRSFPLSKACDSSAQRITKRACCRLSLKAFTRMTSEPF